MLFFFVLDEAGQFCLIQSNLTMPEDGGAGRVVGGGTTREYVLEDDECPLAILMNHQARQSTFFRDSEMEAYTIHLLPVY